MPSTLKRTNSIRDTPDPEDDKPNKKNRKIQQDIEEEDDKDEENEERVDRTGQTSENNLINHVDFDNMEINEAGTIARVEVVNFMCHKYLKVDLGPKINFVIGHNGSGKSAILTAITLALGANASATNRGKNLSAFIKEGTSAANITIHLTNGGSQAYKPDQYPGMIVVERRLNKDGPSPYKLKNASGRIVSQKKEELVAILDNFSILVNNPLTMLTQDMARKFLSDSTSEDKYRLFMNGTQLTQLRQDFEAVRESLDTAKNTLERKREGLPKLQADANEAQRKVKDIADAKEIESQIDTLSNELVWSQIISKEKEVEKNAREVAVAQKNYDDSCNMIQVQNAKIEQIKNNIESVQNELDEFLSVPDPHAEEKRDLLDQKLKKDVAMQDFRTELVEINGTIKSTRAQKERHERSLQTETEKLEASSLLKRNEITDDINKAKEKMEDKIKKAKQFKIEYRDIGEELKEAKEKRQSMMHETRSCREKMDKMKRTIHNLEAQRGDRMRAFGHNMPQVLEAIRRESRWTKRKPVGPIGSTLKLLKPQYADTLETFFLKALNAFVVECFEDKNLLFSILARNKMQQTTIFVSEYDLFDYSSGEPDPHYLTVLRAIHFEDEWAKRQLITSNKIEKTLLMENRAEADQVMYAKPRNIHLCFTSGGHKVGGKSGMRTETLEQYRGPPRFQTDVDVQIRKHRQTIEALETTRQDLEFKYRKMTDLLNDLEKRQLACRQNENQLDVEIKNLERYIEEKEDTLKEDDPVDLNMYVEHIKECTDKIKNYAQQFQSINVQRETAIGELKEILKKIQSIKAKEEDRESISNEYRTKLSKLRDIKSKLQEQHREQCSQKQTLKSRLESRKSVYNDNFDMVTRWTEESREDYPDRVDTNKSPHEVDIELKRLQTLATQLEEQMGSSIEDIEREATAKMTEWKEAKDVIKGMDKLYRSMKKMLEKRTRKWEMFRDYMSLSARHYFSFYLHLRGDEGSLKFNHQTKKLDLRVSTGDQYSKGSRQKDSRSLSGGEKSFSQISLLLSLWQSISSPIICLDEFDVFMDAVNRKQTMTMIMNAASDNSSQYILITPQDASNMIPGKHVRIHRLADPDR